MWILAISCTALTTNAWELDFGTNLTGWMQLRLPKLEAGQQVTIRFADKRLASAKEEVTPALAMLVGWRGWNPDDLWSFGFLQKHEVE